MTQPEYWAAVGNNEWMQQAACIREKADPKIFDTVVDTNDPRTPEFLYEKQAMSYCNKCPVSMDCLLYAKRYMKGYTGIVGRSRLVNGRIKEERNGARSV